MIYRGNSAIEWTVFTIMVVASLVLTFLSTYRFGWW